MGGASGVRAGVYSVVELEQVYERFGKFQEEKESSIGVESVLSASLRGPKNFSRPVIFLLGKFQGKGVAIAFSHALLRQHSIVRREGQSDD